MRAVLIALVAIAVCLAGSAAAQQCDTPSGRTTLDANTVSARLSNSGALLQYDPWSYEVPKGAAVGTFYTIGLWMGGYRDTTLAVAGTDFGLRTDYKPGPLDADGQLAPDCSLYNRIWTVHRDDVANYSATGIASTDLAEWPTGLGAPTLDEDGNEIDLSGSPLDERKHRLIDLAAGERPQMYGDEMAWWIINDAGATHEVAEGGAPIGLEVHATAFARSGDGPIDNTTFFRLKLFNKGATDLDSTFIGLFLDGDVGSQHDDYMGTDTLRHMAFFYNGDNVDEQTTSSIGYGAAPPAIGVVFLDSPAGLANTMPAWGSHYWPDGVPRTALDYYNRLRGRWIDGSKLKYGFDGYDSTGPSVDYIFPADPGEFWSELNIDGQETPMSPGDRSMVMSSGPFDFRNVQSETLDFAIVWSRSTDFLASVDQLKTDVDAIQEAYDAEFRVVNVDSRPTSTSDAQQVSVYPNPASRTVNASFSLLHPMSVEIEIFDMLGRRVVSHPTRWMGPGKHTVPLSAENLTSGVYSLQLRTAGHILSTQFLIRR